MSASNISSSCNGSFPQTSLSRQHPLGAGGWVGMRPPTSRKRMNKESCFYSFAEVKKLLYFSNNRIKFDQHVFHLNAFLFLLVSASHLGWSSILTWNVTSSFEKDVDIFGVILFFKHSLQNHSNKSWVACWKTQQFSKRFEKL